MKEDILNNYSFNIISDKQNKFDLNFNIKKNSLNIFIKKDNMEEYNTTLSLETFDSYFYKKNIEDIKTILSSLLINNEYLLVEEENIIILTFILNNNGQEKLSIKLNKKSKDIFSIIGELYKKINLIELELKSLKFINTELKLENKGMRQEINDAIEKNKLLFKKIEKLKKYIKNNNIIKNNNKDNKNNKINSENKKEENKNEINFKKSISNDYYLNSNKKTNLLNNDSKNNNIINNEKEKTEIPSHIIKSTDYINCLKLLSDGRFVSCSDDCLIHIYNIQTYEEEITIKDNTDDVIFIFEMTNKNLVSSSRNGIINIYKIFEKDYKLLETLKIRKSIIYKVIEDNENSLISCNSDKQINLWSKTLNNIFELQTPFYFKNSIENIEKLDDSEIICSSKEGKFLIFFNIKIRQEITKINDLNCVDNHSSMCINKEKNLLYLGGYYRIYIINTKTKKLINTINRTNIINSIYFNISSYCLFVGEYFTLCKYLIENDNLTLISKINNIHNNKITSIIQLDNDSLATSSLDKTIKIWKFNKQNN